ncbi:ATP-dependent Clp protease proteolytic subunit [Vibrio vulnificus]|nr:ATP-dependent Clp protease proteolytic subunit [Vibrio vulnificus]
MSYIIPSVEYVEQGIHKTANPFSYMLNERVVFLYGDVNPISANAIVAQLLALAKKDEKKDIDFYINSGGGHVTEGLAIYDTMLSLPCKVNTVCVGQACSMGAFLLAGGTGKRVATPNSRVMIHQVLGGTQGQATDIQIQAEETLRLKKLLTQILSENSERTYDEMYAACERDNFLTPPRAVEFGLIDSVLEPTHKRK